MKKVFLPSVISALLLVGVAQAMPPKPEKCPDVSAIKSVGVEVAERANDGTWVAGVLSNHYDTQDDWTFGMIKIRARNEDEALKKAAKGLGSLSFQHGPMAVEQYNVWACLYNTATGYPAVTINPAQGLSKLVGIR